MLALYLFRSKALVDEVTFIRPFLKNEAVDAVVLTRGFKMKLPAARYSIAGIFEVILLIACGGSYLFFMGPGYSFFLHEPFEVTL